LTAHGRDHDDAPHVDDRPAWEHGALLGTLVAALDADALAATIETATGGFLELGRGDPDLAGRLAEPLPPYVRESGLARRSAPADLARLRHRARPRPLGAASGVNVTGDFGVSGDRTSAPSCPRALDREAGR
jgi:hypothetical protein